MSFRKTKMQLFISTRPECIKLAPLVAEIESRPEEFELSVCLTSQQREMLRQAFKWFSIQVHHGLDVMSYGQHLIDNRYTPWPEELNRTLIGRLAGCHLAPTLKREFQYCKPRE